MPLSTVLPPVMVLAPQSGWALTQAKPREVGRLYWELIPETEVWVPTHATKQTPPARGTAWSGVASFGGRAVKRRGCA